MYTDLVRNIGLFRDMSWNPEDIIFIEKICTKVRIKFNDGMSEPIHINKGLRQECRLSPVLFHTYINKIKQEFKRVMKNGIVLNYRKLVNTILSADDPILIATSEDELQTVTYHLNFIARKKNDHIQHKNKINGNVGKPHTEGENCDNW